MIERREQGIKRKCHIYTDEEKQFLREFVPGHSYMEIREAFRNKFHWNITTDQVKGCITRYGLNTGRKGCFPKGHKPVNKGKRMPSEVYEKCKKTMFKKGNIPANHRPVGSERITVDGYIEIKVEEPNKWNLKHRVLWEQSNGKVPENHVIIFLDGNPLNTELSNLKLVSKGERLMMNRRNLFSKDAELTDVGSNLAKLICKTYEKERKG